MWRTCGIVCHAALRAPCVSEAHKALDSAWNCVFFQKRDKIWPSSKLLGQEHSFSECLRISIYSKASGCCCWLSLLSLMWWHSAVASQGHPLGSPSESGISRDYMFKVNHSSLADVPQQDSYRALCWGLKNGIEFSNSMLWPDTPE